MFRLDAVSYTHGNGQVALRELTLAAGRGEQLAIIGPSGAGKTTLLRLLSAALRPGSGELALLDTAPWTLDAAALRRLRSRIGVAHQAPPLPGRQRVITAILAGRLGVWPWWKALASLVYPLDIAGAHRALASLDLAERLFERCDRLSGGQLQRVGVARLLYQRPQLVLADEPVSSLDPTLGLKTLQALSADAGARDATLVVSLHAVDLALACFPRIVGIRDGRVAFDRPAAQVDEILLRDLYAAEGRQIPVQDDEPMDAEDASNAPPAPVARRSGCA